MNGKTLPLIPARMFATKILTEEKKEVAVATSQRSNQISVEKSPRNSRTRNCPTTLMISELTRRVNKPNSQTIGTTGEEEILAETSARMKKKPCVREDRHRLPMIAKAIVVPLPVTVIRNRLHTKGGKASCLLGWPSKRNRTDCQVKALPKRPGEWALLLMLPAASLTVHT